MVFKIHKHHKIVHPVGNNQTLHQNFNIHIHRHRYRGCSSNPDGSISCLTKASDTQPCYKKKKFKKFWIKIRISKTASGWNLQRFRHLFCEFWKAMSRRCLWFLGTMDRVFDIMWWRRRSNKKTKLCYFVLSLFTRVSTFQTLSRQSRYRGTFLRIKCKELSFCKI